MALSSAIATAAHDLLPAVTALRHHLHAHPRVSGDEDETASYIRGFLSHVTGGALEPAHTAVGGGHGMVYVIQGEGHAGGDHESCGTVLLRADMDALPLVEKASASELPYASTRSGAHHACGHDGHSAMLAGSMVVLQAMRQSFSGRVVCVFQPAEETGVGAQQMLGSGGKDCEQLELIVGGGHQAAPAADRGCFGLHNLPGSPLGQVVLKEGGVAARASCGLRFRLVGKAGHASEPHLGRTALVPAAMLAQALETLPTRRGGVLLGGLVTPVHIAAGAAGDFGVLPGSSEVCVTLRHDSTAGVQELKEAAEEEAQTIARQGGIQVEAVEEVEPFPATLNEPWSAQIVGQAASQVHVHFEGQQQQQQQQQQEKEDEEESGYDNSGRGLPVRWLDQPFPWSEDFGAFPEKRGGGGALFGLGAGLDHPPLHASNYDFPDEILPLGMQLWTHIALGALGAREGWKA